MNWIATYYRNNKVIHTEVFKNRTEHEAENEAMGLMPSNANDWSLVELITVNLDNAMSATRFEHIVQKNADGTPVRCKRNGKTKTWKTREGQFRIPVKYGLRGCFYIDNFEYNNTGDWRVIE